MIRPTRMPFELNKEKRKTLAFVRFLPEHLVRVKVNACPCFVAGLTVNKQTIPGRSLSLKMATLMLAMTQLTE
jgi:hypothetical protein